MGIVNKEPANFNPNVIVPTKVDSFRFWCQKVLPLVYDDSLSYYELLCKVVDYLNNTINDVNILGTDVDNLNKAFIQLQGYVNDYFTTLDVQQEINKKLDEMANDGTLLALFSNYMLYSVNNVKELKNSNLLNNSRVKTLGYYNINDGGGADYFITNVKPTEYYEKLNNGNYAVLDKNANNVRQFGAYGDGVHDDTNSIQICINERDSVLIDNGTYLVTNTIHLKSGQTISGFNSELWDNTKTVILSEITNNQPTITTSEVKNTALAYYNNNNNSQTKNCKITNIKILGQNRPFCGILLNGYNAILDNVICQGFTIGLSIITSYWNHISNCNFTDNEIGIMLNNANFNNNFSNIWVQFGIDYKSHTIVNAFLEQVYAGSGTSINYPTGISLINQSGFTYNNIYIEAEQNAIDCGDYSDIYGGLIQFEAISRYILNISGTKQIQFYSTRCFERGETSGATWVNYNGVQYNQITVVGGNTRLENNYSGNNTVSNIPMYANYASVINERFSTNEILEVDCNELSGGCYYVNGYGAGTKNAPVKDYFFLMCCGLKDRVRGQIAWNYNTFYFRAQNVNTGGWNEWIAK